MIYRVVSIVMHAVAVGLVVASVALVGAAIPAIQLAAPLSASIKLFAQFIAVCRSVKT